VRIYPNSNADSGLNKEPLFGIHRENHFLMGCAYSSLALLKVMLPLGILSFEEAQEGIIGVLDRSMLEGVMSLRVIHGHGSGKLKTLVRQYCSDSPYVAQFRAGEKEDGGDGVTIVELK